VLAVLHAPRFRDAAPAAVYATLLDEGVYLASERTMYRLLAAAGETRERRDQLVHPPYHKPELLATAPNQVWSWDITKLLGPAKWTYYYLYVLLDIYSRYVPGWMVAHREHAALAERLMAETLAKQSIPPGQLTLHADRGSSMTSGRVLARGPGRHQDSLPAARLQRQSLLGGAVQDAPMPAASPTASPRSRRLAPSARLSSVVQHRASALGLGLLPPDGPLWAGAGRTMRAARCWTPLTPPHPERYPPAAATAPLPTAAWINRQPTSDTQEAAVIDRWVSQT
jgi:putative transposase